MVAWPRWLSSNGFYKEVQGVGMVDAAGNFVDPNTSAGTKVEIIPVTDISGAVSAGEIVFDFVAFEALSAAGRITMLQDLLVSDKDDTGATLKLIFADSLLDLGVLNATPTITDADTFKILAVVDIAAADWLDLGGARVAYKSNIGGILEAAAGTQCYVAGMATAGGTGGTWTNASNLQLRAGLLQG